jgi:deoxyribose-phosphate aldolase
MKKEELAKYIDQTLLNPCATPEQVSNFCKEAASLGFKSVCVNPVYVSLAAKILEGSDTLVCTVIDFPLGQGGITVKNEIASTAILAGADELDLVINLGMVKASMWSELEKQLCEFTKVVYNLKTKKGLRPITKLILETCYLTDEEIVQSSMCAKKAGFDFVKTSTGFAILKDKEGKLLPSGASVNAVKLMREAVGPSMGVKASGGIHNYDEALLMIKAGATRIGSSCGKEILDDAR